MAARNDQPDNPIPSDQPVSGQVLAPTSPQNKTIAFAGPLPPPSILAAYEQILPGAAERIIRIAEDEAVHQRSMEQFAAKQQFTENRVGQVFGLSIGIFGLLISGILGYTGHDTVAGVIGGTALGSLVTVFVVGRTKDSPPSQE
jgi:uncharacterized membrane protein